MERKGTGEKKYPKLSSSLVIFLLMIIDLLLYSFPVQTQSMESAALLLEVTFSVYLYRPAGYITGYDAAYIRNSSGYTMAYKG